MRLHRDDFEMLKVIGRGAFGEVRNPRCPFGMFKSAGKSPLNYCSLVWFVFGISKLCFHVPFCVSNENPKLSAKVFMSPSSILSAATNQTPFLSSEFPFSLPLPIPQGSRPGVGLLFLGRHKSRHFRRLVCFTRECATRSCSKTLELFTSRTVHFSFSLPLCLLSLLHFPFLPFRLPTFHHSGIRLLSVEKPVPCIKRKTHVI